MIAALFWVAMPTPHSHVAKPSCSAFPASTASLEAQIGCQPPYHGDVTPCVHAQFNNLKCKAIEEAHASAGNLQVLWQMRARV